MKKKASLFSCLFFITISALSQVKENEITIRNSKGKPELINFKETKVNADDKSVNAFLKKQFESKTDDDFVLDSKNTRIENKLESKKYKQYYKGLKVEFGIQNVVSENGVIKTVSGKYIDTQDLDTKPKLLEKDALAFALLGIGAKEYMWEKKENEDFLKNEKKDKTATYYPKGELVIIEKDLFGENPIPKLAFKFLIYASNPSKTEYIYIDANNGEVLLIEPTMIPIQGIADTKYSGQRTIETQLVGSQYKLRDYSRGNGIETYNMNHNIAPNFSLATDFIDNDNNWSSTEYNNVNKDNVALDAHWGAEKTYDYFLSKHNRNSYDGLGGVIKSYVHYSNNYDNAGWRSVEKVMIYGDGYYYNPLTSIDIVGHEIGHGVCFSTANLLYQNESGAINEALSDIWGAMIEYYADPSKQTYLLGEEVNGIRSMSNPKYYGDPDTYGGTYWANPNCGTANDSNDYCGVHNNSGVLNHWFYILAEGKSGTNDLGNSYNVAGIGKDKAAKIVYRAETVYFTSTTNFAQARTLTLQAANDLYGANSVESTTVCQSWYAVGVGSGVCSANAQITGADIICDRTLNNSYLLTNQFSNSTVVWSVSSNLSLVSYTNTSVVVKALNASSAGLATVTANISGQIVSKNIWIGNPTFSVQKTNETCGQYRFVTLTVTNSDTSHIYNYSFSYLPTGVTYVQTSYNVFLFKISNTYTQNSFTYAVTATLGCATGTYGNYVMFSSCPPFGSSTTNTLNTTATGETTIYKIYPNPSENILNISLFDENNVPAKTSTINASLYDLNGQKVEGIVVVNNTASLNVSHYKKGIYILKINIDGKTETHQVIVK